MIHAMLILLTCQLVGESLSRIFAVPIPGPVLGMVLLLVVLFIRKGVPSALESSATGLLNHMALLFVPAGVGIMTQFARLRAEWLPLLASLLVSTSITLIVTAVVFQALERRMSTPHLEHDHDA